MKYKASKKDIGRVIPFGFCPGINVRPSTLTAKIRISPINGARIRRNTRKIVTDASAADASGTRRCLWRTLSDCGPKSRRHKSKSGCANATFPSPTVERHRLDGDQHDGHDVGQQRAPGERDDARHGVSVQLLGDVLRIPNQFVSSWTSISFSG